jgi:hypothetical protein
MMMIIITTTQYARLQLQSQWLEKQLKQQY